jgi:hypothetical protein
MSRSNLIRVIVLALALAAGSASATDSSTYSEAERRVFTQNHLSELPRGAVLAYSFERRGSLEPAIDDQAQVRIGAPASASAGREAAVSFLSGQHKLELPDVANAEGNPAILFFLERQVREMNRLTRGSTNYYRKRIRMALAEGATMKPVQVSVQGREVRATEIHLDPYRNDPARSRYEKFAGTIYVLTLSDDVPGRVIELRSELLDASAQDRPLLLGETLRFAGQR